jgi:hypothetical protein
MAVDPKPPKQIAQRSEVSVAHTVRTEALLGHLENADCRQELFGLQTNQLCDCRFRQGVNVPQDRGRVWEPPKNGEYGQVAFAEARQFETQGGPLGIQRVTFLDALFSEALGTVNAQRQWRLTVQNQLIQWKPVLLAERGI